MGWLDIGSDGASLAGKANAPAQNLTSHASVGDLIAEDN
jgi:hypothetical protein